MTYLPSDLQEKIHSIIVNRIGYHSKAYMKTTDVLGYIQPNKFYQLTNENLILTNNYIDLVEKGQPVTGDPSVVEFTGQWDFNKEEISDGNILGKTISLQTELETLIIPEVECNKENLAYYGAKLVRIDEKIKFDTPDNLPITTVEIGEKYVPDYLLQSGKGGGFYLEYHNTPHFHFPLNSDSIDGGCLVLGKKNNNKYQLSAFRIPLGQGIYTPPNVLHCDGYLMGKYLVVYTLTQTYSTAIIKHNNQIVKVKIV